MEISVRLSAGLSQNTGSSRLRVTLPEDACVRDLLDFLQHEYPTLDEKLSHTVAVVSGRHVNAEEPLSAGQEVALLLPISGGSGS